MIDILFDGLPHASTITVVDLGAGTGISSRLLAANGASVLALEPNAGYATNENDPTARKNDHGRAAFAAYHAWRRLRTVEIDHAQSLDRDAIHAGARSTSYLPNEGARADLLHDEIDRLFKRGRATAR